MEVSTAKPVPNLEKGVTDSTEEFTIIHTGVHAPRKSALKTPSTPLAKDDEPLIDTTAPLLLNSKKTKRLQKQMAKKKQKRPLHPTSFLDLPLELTIQILSHVFPSDIFTLLHLSKSTRSFILANNTTLSRELISLHFPFISKCFPLPLPYSTLDSLTQDVLLNPRRQEMLTIHKKPYQHIPPLDPLKICSCTTCLFSWNKLALILDYAHFQKHHLLKRDPIPMIKRGTNPDWNIALLESHASILEKAMADPLAYARVLQTHWKSIVQNLKFRIDPSSITETKKAPVHRHNRRFAPPPAATTNTANSPRPLTPTTTSHPTPLSSTARTPLLYSATLPTLASTQSDSFLALPGPHSYEFPFHRDNYYSLGPYMPDRKFSREENEWKYFDQAVSHERDCELAKRWFRPASVLESERKREGELFPRPPR